MKFPVLILVPVILFTACISSGLTEDFIFDPDAHPAQLTTRGTSIVFACKPDNTIRLKGLNIPGAEYMKVPAEEHIMRSTVAAIKDWKANIIRLPVDLNAWNGKRLWGYPGEPPSDGGAECRKQIKEIIDFISESGSYCILDLHHFESFTQEAKDFWIEVANMDYYKNNPFVLFGILNEAHSVSWKVWRDGDGKGKIGHQEVIEAIRDAGAKNIIVAGGLSYAYDLRGVTGDAPGDNTVYALLDQGSDNDLSKRGYGIIYDTHIYPWHDNWDENVGQTRLKYPLIVGEVGFDYDDPIQKQYRSSLKHDEWVPSIFNWINNKGYKYPGPVSWIGWCFNPSATPRILAEKENWNKSDYSYPPSEFWGVFVKAELEKK